MRINTIILLTFLYSAVYAQKESKVYITLVNTPDLNVEKRHFFEQEENYSLEDKTDNQLAFQFNRGKILPEGKKFNVTKTKDDWRCYI